MQARMRRFASIVLGGRGMTPEREQEILDRVKKLLVSQYANKTGLGFRRIEARVTAGDTIAISTTRHRYDRLEDGRILRGIDATIVVDAVDQAWNAIGLDEVEGLVILDAVNHRGMLQLEVFEVGDPETPYPDYRVRQRYLGTTKGGQKLVGKTVTWTRRALTQWDNVFKGSRLTGEMIQFRGSFPSDAIIEVLTVSLANTRTVIVNALLRISYSSYSIHDRCRLACVDENRWAIVTGQEQEVIWQLLRFRRPRPTIAEPGISIDPEDEAALAKLGG